MREYFKGWKQKAGCVTLVMACVFGAGWIRSFAVTDGIQLNPVSVTSMDISIILESGEHLIDGHISWESWEFIQLDAMLKGELDELRRFCGFGVVVNSTSQLWIIPYYGIVLPLTLLSAYLLLSMPHKPKQSASLSASSESASPPPGYPLPAESTDARPT